MSHELDYRSNSHQAVENPHFCIFCEIFRGKEPGSIISRKEKEGVITYMSLEGYPLVSPISHISASKVLTGLTKDERRILANVSNMIAEILPVASIAYETESFNIVTNIGSNAGQEIDHIHTHLVPRTPGDKAVMMRRLASPPPTELERLAGLMRNRLKQLKP